MMTVLDPWDWHQEVNLHAKKDIHADMTSSFGVLIQSSPGLFFPIEITRLRIQTFNWTGVFPAEHSDRQLSISGVYINVLIRWLGG